MTTPFTPRPHSRSSHIGLSNKQLNKINGTIATVRRNRHLKTGGEYIEELDEPLLSGYERRTEDGRDRERRKDPKHTNGHVEHGARPAPQMQEETSFAAEASFVRAPLNSRLPNRPLFPSPAPNSKGKGKGKEGDPSSLQGVPTEVQEALILEDLLHVLMGIPGTYITVHPSYDPEVSPDGVIFTADPTLDASLRDLVERILPLATYYTAVSSFVQQRSQLECGLVNHALCAAIRDMLSNDYLTLVAQLEHLFNTSPGFSLQKLWFYVHPTLHTLSLIHALTDELIRSDAAQMDDEEEDAEDDEVDEIDAMDEALGLGFGKKNKLKALDALDDVGIIKGGEVVAVIWERVMNMSGDPTAHELYLTLFRHASAPYATMLQRWMTTGQLKDPHDEFMVKESRDINRGIIEVDYIDDYWERRYTLRDGSAVAGSDRRQTGIPKPRAESGRMPGGACVPPLLESWKQKILLAGKYLNVIRECGLDVNLGGPEPTTDGGEKSSKKKRKEVAREVIPLDDERFYQSIEDAYTWANRTLLQLLVKDEDLIPRLRSLKYYFFLSHSAYLGGFFETAKSELAKPAKAANLNKLQSLFELALAGSPGPEEGGGTSVFRGDVKLTMESLTLWDFLTNVLSIEGAVIGSDPLGVENVEKRKGKDKESKDQQMVIQAIEGIALDYTVKFPLSLIISRRAVLHYQLLFRFLLHLKHAEQALTDMWSEHKSPPWSSRSGHVELERWKLRVVLLRTKMLAFVQQVLAFATGDILEPSWRSLEGKLAKAAKEGSQGTVDQLLRDHSDFLNTCMKGCLLTTSRFLKLYSNLVHTSSRFVAYSSKITRALVQAMDALAKGDEHLESSPMQPRWDILQKFEVNFGHNLKAFYDHVQYSAMSEVALLPLVHRLNQGRGNV